MDHDMSKGTRRALKLAGSRHLQPAGPLLDHAKGNELVARARAAIGAPPRTYTATPSVPASETRAEIVRLPITCGATGGAFVGIAERCGNRLRFIGHEFPRTRQDGEYRPGPLSGEYHIDMKEGWACPLCNSGGAAQGIWMCQCAHLHGALQCGGMSGRARYCSCGRLEERQLVVAETFQVRGASVAATPGRTRAAPQHHGQLQSQTGDS